MPRAPDRPLIVDEALLPGSKLTKSAEKSWSVRKADRQRTLHITCEQDKSFVQTRGHLSRTVSLPALEDGQSRAEKLAETEIGQNDDRIVPRSRRMMLPKAASAMEAVRLLSMEPKADQGESPSSYACPSSPVSPVSPVSPKTTFRPASPLSPMSPSVMRGIGIEKADDYLMPKSVERLTYWSAVQYFDVSDLKKTGVLDRPTFFNCVYSIVRAGGEREPMTRQRADDIFSQIDLDDDRTVNKEEFLSWVFQTSSNYVSSLRGKLQVLEPYKVKQIFKGIDSDGNGVLDQDEFWYFIDKHSVTAMSREECDALFDFIDANCSGGLDADEFMNWIFPRRELRLLQGKKDKETAYDRVDRIKEEANNEFDDLCNSGKHHHHHHHHHHQVTEFDEDDSQAAVRGIMEIQPNKPVTLLFTVTKAFDPTFQSMKRALRQIFSPSQIRFELVYDPAGLNCTCFRLEAQVGRGIVLWDRASMMATEEDPFTGEEAAATWVKEVLTKTLPDVLGAANLRRAKKAKKLQRRKAKAEAAEA